MTHDVFRPARMGSGGLGRTAARVLIAIAAGPRSAADTAAVTGDRVRTMKEGAGGSPVGRAGDMVGAARYVRAQRQRR